MAATRTARTSRRSAIKVPANVPETDQEMEAIIDRKPTTRRRPAAKAPADMTGVQADALTSVAAPTLLGVNGEMVRHTQDYTVDLLDQGEEPDRDFSKVLAKDPSETHRDFVAWVAEYVGYDADVRTVQILISTYHEFQKTPAQKAKTIAKRLVAAEKRAAAAQKKAAKTAAPVAK